MNYNKLRERPQEFRLVIGLNIEEFDNWSAKYEIEITNKKINPDKKTVWIYDENYTN